MLILGLGNQIKKFICTLGITGKQMVHASNTVYFFLDENHLPWDFIVIVQLRFTKDGPF